MKILFLNILFVFCSAGLFSQNIIGGEILGRPSNSSIHVKAIFDTSVEVRIKYGMTTGVYLYQTTWEQFFQDSLGEAIANIELDSLSPSTEYFYLLQFRILGDTAIISRPEHSFFTARAYGETFSFDVEADPHLDYNSDTALFSICLQNILEDKPDFMFDLGDNFMTEKQKNEFGVVPIDTIPYRCKLLRSFYDKSCHSIPLFLVIGNHEGECGWYNNGTANNIAVWNTNFRKKYFSNPTPDTFYSGDTTTYSYIGKREAYYSFEWGNALFVVLDPYWNTSPKPDSLNAWRWTLGKTQYDWLKETLENSTSDFKFVFAHQLVGANKDGRGGIEMAEGYEWGGLNIDSTEGWAANRPGWYKPIKELLEENRVTIFFHGHDHLYVKQDLNCLVYQETPQPSLPNFQGTQTASLYGYVNGTIKPNSGHLRVTVSSSNVTVQYIRAMRPTQETSSMHNKDIVDSYQIGLVNCYDSLTNSQEVIQNIFSSEVFPNPINEHTLLKYQIAENTDVLITITDMLGVETIILNNKHGSGEYILNLDKEIKGLHYGMYCLRISAGKESKTLKLIKTK